MTEHAEGGEQQTAAARRDVAVFCDRVWGPLTRALHVQLGNRETAEELAQDALAKIWNDWDRVSTMDHPEAYAFRVAFNASSSLFRRKAAERRAHRRVGSVQTESTPHLMSAETLDLQRAVAGLPRRQRDVIILRYFVDMRVDDVAVALGISPGTVKTSAHRAMATLRSVLADEERNSL